MCRGPWGLLPTVDSASRVTTDHSHTHYLKTFTSRRDKVQHHIRCVVGEVDEGGRRPAAARLVHAEQLVSAGNLRSALSLPIALRDKLTGLDARTFCSHDMLSSSIVLSPAHQSHDMRSAGIETARRTADVHASQRPEHHEPIHSLLLIFASISARASSSVIPPGARVGQNNCVMPIQRKR